MSSDALLIVRVEKGIAWRLRAMRLVMTGAADEGAADTWGDDDRAPFEEAVAEGRPVVGFVASLVPDE